MSVHTQVALRLGGKCLGGKCLGGKCLGGKCLGGSPTLVAMFCAMLVGCSSSMNIEAKVAKYNAHNIQRLTNAYGLYQLSHGYYGPKDEADFKKYLKEEMPPRKRELMQIDPNAIDQLFISERDGKPFKIRYGLQSGYLITVAPVFEDTGADGKRQVGLTNGSVEDVDDARYKQLWESKIARSDAPGPGSPEEPAEAAKSAPSG